jgi:lipoprotein-releasing system ATP-binding protein
MTLLTVANLSKSYQTPGGRIDVLRHLDLSVGEGEMVAVVGASGVGKSTLLHVLGGLDVVDGGSVRIDGIDVARLDDAARVAFRNQRIGFIFQFHHLLPEFTARENVEMPLRIARLPGREARVRAETLLEAVGLGGRLDHRPGLLSGGEQQRVAIARALVTNPQLLLADEPTGNLDEHTADALHGLLREMQRERRLTAVIATHNARLASVCDRVLRLEDGHLAPADRRA